MAMIPYVFVVGGRYWYYRRGSFRRRLYGSPGESAFQKSYEAAQLSFASHSEKKQRRAAAARTRRLDSARQQSEIVYLIGSGAGPVKIGFTTNLAKRLQRLQMSSPRKLSILAQRSATRGSEIELHRRHRSARLHGEWFKRTPEILALIDEHGEWPCTA